MRLIIDTDPGMGVLGSDPEDAFAITYCLASPECDVVGITVVNGNVPADLAYRNARHILDLHDETRIPLTSGSSRPLSGTRPDVLQWQGLRRRQRVITPVHDDPSLGAPQQIVDSIMASEQPTTVLAIGPLTNLAVALVLAPQIVPRVERVVVMGGKGRVAGNVTPAAEFNFWCDPEAAEITLTAGWPITMVTLEVCNRVRMTPELINSGTKSSAFGAFAREACAPWFAADHGGLGFPLFDTLAAATVTHPHVLTTQPALVEIDASHGPSAGADTCWLETDHLGRPLPATNVDLAVAVDTAAFQRLFTERVLKRL